VPPWLHTVAHWLQWGTVPAWVAAAISIWQANRSAKASRSSQAAEQEAKLTAQAAEDEMAWRIHWYQPMEWGGTKNTGRYSLVNKSKTPKYDVSVTGATGTNNWAVIYEGESKELDAPCEPKTDEPFTVAWHVKPGQTDSARTSKVWGQ
jgi:hypothetical protein